MKKMKKFCSGSGSTTLVGDALFIGYLLVLVIRFPSKLALSPPPHTMKYVDYNRSYVISESEDQVRKWYVKHKFICPLLLLHLFATVGNPR
jgi:hypothetical protein